MRKLLLKIIISCALLPGSLTAQSLYFPPLTGNTWETVSTSSLGWCNENIDSLYTYLEDKNTKAFIVLQDGKIAIEKYFGSFTADSIWYWASASKSLTSVLTGIAQQENLLNIYDTVSDYLGNGWTSCTIEEERQITIHNLLTMTSGLNDTIGFPCSNNDTAASCLQFKADAGTRWAYHTGAYRKLEELISNASSMSYNSFTYNYLSLHTGISGAWIAQVFYSKPRSMARFGLLALNNGVWDNDTVLNDTAYFKAMTSTSQSFNESYGYLWWLNGKNSYMAPALQYVFPFQLFPDAPIDLFAALGKNDQKIYVVPSRNMVVVRVGDAAYSSALAFSQFDNELWQYLDKLKCQTKINETNDKRISIFPNPVKTVLNINIEASENFEVELLNISGETLFVKQNESIIDVSNLENGFYFVKIKLKHEIETFKIIKQ